jgi:hypothetical protein
VAGGVGARLLKAQQYEEMARQVSDPVLPESYSEPARECLRGRAPRDPAGERAGEGAGWRAVY